MVKTCCIKRCKSEWKISEGVTFHRFPIEKEARERFLEAIPQSLQPKITKYSVICSKHFTTDSFTYTDCQCRLKTRAIPTLFEYDADHLLHLKSETSVQCEPSTSSTNAVLHEEESQIDDPLDTTMEECDNQKMKDVSVQTSETYVALHNELQHLRKKVIVLQKRLRRRDIRINSMTDVIEHLKQNRLCTPTMEEVLSNRFSDFTFELFNNEMRNSSVNLHAKRYSEEMKSFALTLYFYSPKAYHFIRSKINLPHSSTLRNWLSTYDCEPGFIAETINFLKEEVKQNTCLRNVALIFDSMAIRSEIIYDKKCDKYRGYIDYGGIANVDSEELATECLVFQIVSYAKKFKIPIAFFFINKIIAELQCEIVKHALVILQEIGITVRSVTCDGCATNLKTLTLLGHNFYNKDFTTSFKHPTTDDNVYCILDACHMLKLCRNSFAETNISSPRGNISFQYIKKLHEVQEEEDLKLANKISVAHVNFHKKKMNVRLAVQVISSGVADAIDYLRISGDPRFAGSESTTEFLRIFDQLFDIMNSRSAFAKGYKSPIFLHNIEYINEFFENTRKYIQSLAINGKNILCHNRKTFALGFIANTFSILELSISLLREPDGLKYFLTYKCSQDHLELFFSCIRSRGGWNDNPNSLEFMWAMRKLLFRNNVTASINANCVMDDAISLPILQFRRANRNIVENHIHSDEEDDSNIEQLLACMNSIALTSLQENILYYITGLVVRKILAKLACPHCIQFLLQSNENSDHLYTVNKHNYNSFTTFINRGKLYFPSKATYNIVKYAEKAFRGEIELCYTKHNFKQRICSVVLKEFSSTIISLFRPPHPIVENDGFHELHELTLLKLIVNTYSTIRIVTYAKKATQRRLGTRVNLRQQLHKNILFANV